MLFEGKTAIVTGAGSPRGIGRAVALALAREGADVAVTEWPGESTSADIAALGRKTFAAAIDVSDAASVRRFVNDAADRFGRLDILVNNAGFCEFVPFLEITDELWQKTMAVNLAGYFAFGQEAARRMAGFGRGGRIVNVTSQAAENAGEEMVHYCVSKAGTAMLTRGMALELAQFGICVNSVAPGTIETNIIHQPHLAALADRERQHPTIPLGRMGTAEDIVGSVLFLCSPASAYMTGATLLVDGGMVAGKRLPEEFRSANFAAAREVSR